MQKKGIKLKHISSNKEATKMRDEEKSVPSNNTQTLKLDLEQARFSESEQKLLAQLIQQQLETAPQNEQNNYRLLANHTYVVKITENGNTHNQPVMLSNEICRRPSKKIAGEFRYDVLSNKLISYGILDPKAREKLHEETDALKEKHPNAEKRCFIIKKTSPTDQEEASSKLEATAAISADEKFLDIHIPEASLNAAVYKSDYYLRVRDNHVDVINKKPKVIKYKRKISSNSDKQAAWGDFEQTLSDLTHTQKEKKIAKRSAVTMTTPLSNDRTLQEVRTTTTFFEGTALGFLNYDELSDGEALTICVESIAALQRFHEATSSPASPEEKEEKRQIVHGDLHNYNLIYNQKIIRIIDFDLSAPAGTLRGAAGLKEFNPNLEEPYRNIISKEAIDTLLEEATASSNSAVCAEMIAKGLDLLKNTLESKYPTLVFTFNVEATKKWVALAENAVDNGYGMRTWAAAATFHKSHTDLGKFINENQAEIPEKHALHQAFLTFSACLEAIEQAATGSREKLPQNFTPEYLNGLISKLNTAISMVNNEIKKYSDHAAQEEQKIPHPIKFLFDDSYLKNLNAEQYNSLLKLLSKGLFSDEIKTYAHQWTSSRLDIADVQEKVTTHHDIYALSVTLKSLCKGRPSIKQNEKIQACLEKALDKSLKEQPSLNKMLPIFYEASINQQLTDLNHLKRLIDIQTKYFFDSLIFLREKKIHPDKEFIESITALVHKKLDIEKLQAEIAQTLHKGKIELEKQREYRKKYEKIYGEISKEITDLTTKFGEQLERNTETMNSSCERALNRIEAEIDKMEVIIKKNADAFSEIAHRYEEKSSKSQIITGIIIDLKNQIAEINNFKDTLNNAKESIKNVNPNDQKNHMKNVQSCYEGYCKIFSATQKTASKLHQEKAMEKLENPRDPLLEGTLKVITRPFSMIFGFGLSLVTVGTVPTFVRWMMEGFDFKPVSSVKLEKLNTSIYNIAKDNPLATELTEKEITANLTPGAA
jgi:hypothetical protein